MGTKQPGLVIFGWAPAVTKKTDKMILSQFLTGKS